MSQLNSSYRRHDLDWLRVLVFLLLIFYHVGMFFVPWEWHLKNTTLAPDFQWPMRFVNQWRLPILFVISGMGTAFAMKKRSLKSFAKERSFRLLLPLLIGIVFIVPPQVYFERLTQGAEYKSFVQFLFSDAFNGVYPEGNFSWHHLWFLPYLYTFSMLLIPALFIIRKMPAYKNSKITQKPFVLLIFPIPLFMVEFLLAPRFPVTHAFWNDWYTIPFYTLLFFYGYFIIKKMPKFWEHTEVYRRGLFIVGIILFGLIYTLSEAHFTEFVTDFVLPLIRVFNLWVWILCIFGYAARYLNKISRFLSYCNQAVYPFYILHQTITVGLGYWLQNKPWEISIKFSILLLGTFIITAILYEFFIRRLMVLRPLFGLKLASTNKGKTSQIKPVALARVSFNILIFNRRSHYFRGKK